MEEYSKSILTFRRFHGHAARNTQGQVINNRVVAQPSAVDSSFTDLSACLPGLHYNDIIMGTIASQITSLAIFYSTVYPDADQSKHQSSASLVFVWGIHRRPVNSLHKWSVKRKRFPFDDFIMRKDCGRVRPFIAGSAPLQ